MDKPDDLNERRPVSLKSPEPTQIETVPEDQIDNTAYLQQLHRYIEQHSEKDRLDALLINRMLRWLSGAGTVLVFGSLSMRYAFRGEEPPSGAIFLGVVLLIAAISPWIGTVEFFKKIAEKITKT